MRADAAHTFNGEVLVDVQQVIPLPEAAEYQVRVRERNEQRRVTESIAGDRDKTKFDITVAGYVQRSVNKRRAILIVVRALAAAGIAPEKMMRAVPSRGDRFFVGAVGDLDSAAFVASAVDERVEQGRTFDMRRWFLDDDQLIHFNGKTWAVSNQWGVGTAETLRDLLASFPDAGVSVEPVAI